MTPVIAQIAPEQLKPWLEVFFWLVGSVGALLGCALAWKQLFGAKEKVSLDQPLEVKAHNAFATKEDYDNTHGRISRERREIDAKIARLEAEDARLRESLDAEIKELQNRVDDVPEKMVALLNATGTFHRNRT